MTTSRTRTRALITLVAAAIATAGCGAEAVIAPIIILTNTWAEEGNPEHTVFFSDDTEGEPRSHGTFTGNETLPDGTEFDLEGSWSRGRVEFTVHRAQDVTYEAEIPEDNANRLEFSSSVGSLVLVR